MKTCSFLDEIITSSKEVFEDVQSDMAVGISNLGNATQKTAEGSDTV